MVYSSLAVPRKAHSRGPHERSSSGVRSSQVERSSRGLPPVVLEGSSHMQELSTAEAARWRSPRPAMERTVGPECGEGYDLDGTENQFSTELCNQTPVRKSRTWY